MSELKFGNNLSSIKFGNNRKVIFYTTNGTINDWRYSTATNGQITLYEYIGGDWANTVYVPTASGKAIVNNLTTGTTSNTPFFNNPNVMSVDLQGVPFVSNSMYRAFFNCRNLVSVNNINPNVTSMGGTFQSCYNLNQNIQIPSSVTRMDSTFQSCYNLNQNIQIPSSVTNMVFTFYSCRNLQGTINILSNQITGASGCFASTSKVKNVYIPFKYSNGVNSATFNSFVSAGYLYANGVSNNKHGVTVYDLNNTGGNERDPGTNWDDDDEVGNY